MARITGRPTHTMRLAAGIDAVASMAIFAAGASAMNKPQIDGVWYDDLAAPFDSLGPGDQVVVQGSNLGTAECDPDVTIGQYHVRARNTAVTSGITFEAGPPQAITFALPAGLDPATNYAVTYKLPDSCAGVSAGLSWSPNLLTVGPNKNWRKSNKPGAESVFGLGVLDPRPGVDPPFKTFAVFIRPPVITGGANPSIEFRLRLLEPGRFTLLLQKGYPGPRKDMRAGSNVGWRPLTRTFTAPVKTTEVALQSFVFKVMLKRPLPPGAVLRVVKSENGAVTKHQVMGW